MIHLTRFDGSDYVLNADLIEFVEALPDTHITLVTGKKLLTRESADEVIARVVAYRQQPGSLPRIPIAGMAVAAAHTE